MSVSSGGDASACAKAVMDAVLPVMSYMRRQMRGHRGELSLSQFRMLVRISREPEASLSSLAEHLGSSVSAVSRAVSGLVQQGLLMRAEARGDRRQVVLSLTPQGQAVLDRAHRGAQRRMGAELAPLDGAQRAAIVEAMMALRAVFGPLSGRDAGSDGAEARSGNGHPARQGQAVGEARGRVGSGSTPRAD
jgi:DNA-binding MarR family transcriptional regulator